MQIEDLDLAFANTGRLVRGVRAEQWTEGTPCAEWNLRTLANHTTWVVSMFGDVVQGRPPAVARDAELLGDDPGAAFAATAATTLDAWRDRGFAGTVTFGPGELPVASAFAINVFDTYVHGWDIAQATGQDAELDPALCATLLEVLPSLASVVRRGDNFGPEVDVAADAPVADRLLGYLGRKG
jgi:uncharacterized protein (TIGR03086 family)